ncbi:hypothetical protein, partial [Psychroflexus aestuariivivens]|uniref:hypothetical protein n=1 Tax=Psychroflexus aestuariivivens TaxID=1795040 RepID=UPI001961DB75
SALKSKQVFFRKMFFYMTYNVLAYRFVAGKLVIIFRFMFLFPENPETSISATNSAMSDM